MIEYPGVPWTMYSWCIRWQISESTRGLPVFDCSPTTDLHIPFFGSLALTPLLRVMWLSMVQKIRCHKLAALTLSGLTRPHAWIRETFRATPHCVLIYDGQSWRTLYYFSSGTQILARPILIKTITDALVTLSSPATSPPHNISQLFITVRADNNQES